MCYHETGENYHADALNAKGTFDVIRATRFLSVFVLIPIAVVIGITLFVSAAYAQDAVSPWIEKWTSPQTLIALATFVVAIVLFWSKTDTHVRDEERHHTVEQLGEKFVRRDMCQVTNQQILEAVKRIEAAVNALQEHAMSGK